MFRTLSNFFTQKNTEEKSTVDSINPDDALILKSIDPKCERLAFQLAQQLTTHLDQEKNPEKREEEEKILLGELDGYAIAYFGKNEAAVFSAVSKTLFKYTSKEFVEKLKKSSDYTVANDQAIKLPNFLKEIPEFSNVKVKVNS